ncbi:SWI/SNF-related matrix-associated actin-dependent regulator of chromatin subfamily A-like protein 1 isoform X2 [Agrilus planipennis]|nr:SWI/SNF-related matrix-associated actin-dependent regulator of chromatin subfamily A-like protein 1 isoform X2 [Agrilus planipennis]XP_018333189.1 SWI/SNF-related matrix-associated actin-dependent regulator of chromatin subfamily A-like protein 1 isoform X2 [Agrilus planipennis]XP_018333190.1 SWI/SNF-related matrix-associated actin-dependent regulator of chromatin subfamily A-like protein 1 isoform X2 [Agrilus planipennis]XP_018333191.1 SWI/SNF-related matrix-associated actin-dependent regula
MLDAIQMVLYQNSKKFIRIDGSTTSEQRKYFVDSFQYDDTYVCAILSITAANAGITLTAAKLVIFAELHWNPSILSQAESRAHRIGQEQEVIVQYLLAPGTADDYIWPLLQNKQKTLNEVGLYRDSFEDAFVVKQDLNKKQECLEKHKYLGNVDIYEKPNPILTVSDGIELNAANDCKQDVNMENNLLNDDYDDALSELNLI